MAERVLHLTEEEADELMILLQRATANASVEIRHTKSREYRDHIRHRMNVIAAMETKLDEAVSAHAAGA